MTLALAFHALLGGALAWKYAAQPAPLLVDEWGGEWLELVEAPSLYVAEQPSNRAQVARGAGQMQAQPDAAAQSSVDNLPEVGSSEVEAPALRPSEPRTQESTPEAELSPRPVVRPNSAPASRTKENDDWLSIDDQLPEAASKAPDTVKPAKPDPNEQARIDAFSFRPKLSSGAQAPAEDSAPVKPSRSGASGSEASSPGVRNLAKAFTKSVTMAGSGDHKWLELPLSFEGRLEVTLRVDDQGNIIEHQVHGSPSPPLRQLLKRVLLYLERGRFALNQLEVSAGTQRVELRVSLSERPLAKTWCAGRDPVQLCDKGDRGPLPDGSRRAWFQYASGRYFEARVLLE